MYRKKQNKVKKFRKKFNIRTVRSKHSYSIEEISETLKVHPNTVGRWLKNGLQTTDNQQPYLVFGQILIDFIKAKNSSTKHPCADNELFCCKCQLPRCAKNNTVNVKISNCRTNIIGICNMCGTQINKTISPKKIDFYRNIFNVEVIHQENLLECAKTSATVTKI